MEPLNTIVQTPTNFVQAVEETMTIDQERSAMRIAITGASGNVAYSLAFMVGQGQMFGSGQPIILHLISRPSSIKAVEGLKCELEDCGMPLLEDIVICDSLQKGFENVDIALLVGGCPRGPGMERKDLILKNAEIFREQGKALNRYAKPDVKVCVVGNPCNTMALVCSKNAPDIPLKNFTAITRLDQNRATCQIARKVGTSFKNIQNVIVWGNHSSTQFPDIENAWINNYSNSGVTQKVTSVIGDMNWVTSEFMPTVQKRGGAIIASRGASAAASTAQAICDHMRDWIIGTDGRVVSMGVSSDNNSYGIQDGIIFSFPVTCQNGEWKIVEDYKLTEFSKDMLRVTENELISERIAAAELDAPPMVKKEKVVRLDSMDTDVAESTTSN